LANKRADSVARERKARDRLAAKVDSGVDRNARARSPGKREDFPAVPSPNVDLAKGQSVLVDLGAGHAKIMVRVEVADRV
jgi:hypothetical protein